MLILITGGSGSGKSAYAEEYITEISGECRRYYIATMQVSDKEGQKKVERHKKMRSGKGFCTIEQPMMIEKALEKMCLSEAESEKKPKAALLECMSNLSANEMFKAEAVIDSNTVTEEIIRGVEQLYKGLKHLVIVTNNVFEDGITYDETTMEYIRVMGRINERLAGMADKVIEVVVGIPVIIKEGK